ncbi:hypothetical protein PVK06_018222 [Gossypium arboreum]|uniref:Secreted protein n=1 Tax=Gossypium arboreum TaxID=29729 RepID=A0ABR0Q4V6_GOSAR|nr:hypothetical protein PVK06_018222 [Gossypium arboreum]
MLATSLLAPLFFFFSAATTGPTIGLPCGFFELSRQLNSSSSLLKYSISCITKDPTVPLVPISIG